MNHVKVAMTGARDGMTPQQKILLVEFLKANNIAECHHGDCKGADAAFHDLAKQWSKGKIIIHPPNISTHRAFCRGADEVRPAKRYLVRNKKIVDCADILLAFPSGQEEILRSGTWSTVRYARKRCMHIVIMYPNGKQVHENQIKARHGIKAFFQANTKTLGGKRRAPREASTPVAAGTNPPKKR